MVVIDSGPASWLDIAIAFAGPATGVITAIAVTALTSRAQNRRDATQRKHEVAEAIRKENVVALEATRLEHLRRDLAALEHFTVAAIGMETEISLMHLAAYRSWDEWARVSENESQIATATSFVTLYFEDEMTPEWHAYNVAYRSTRHALVRLALARFRLRDPALTDAKSIEELRADETAVSAEASAEKQAMLTSRGHLLQKIAAVANSRRDDLSSRAA